MFEWFEKITGGRLKESADDIIVEAIIKSIAEEFQDWEVISRDRDDLGTCIADYELLEKVQQIDRDNTVIDHKKVKSRGFCWYAHTSLIPSVCLQNKKKDIKIDFKRGRRHRTVRGKEYFFYEGCVINNDILLDGDAAYRIRNAYGEMKQALDNAKKVSEEALKEMELNEKKWNLVEKLLGMRRNEQGTLVPVTEIQQED